MRRRPQAGQGGAFTQLRDGVAAIEPAAQRGVLGEPLQPERLEVGSGAELDRDRRRLERRHVRRAEVERVAEPRGAEREHRVGVRVVRHLGDVHDGAQPGGARGGEGVSEVHEARDRRVAREVDAHHVPPCARLGAQARRERDRRVGRLGGAAAVDAEEQPRHEREGRVPLPALELLEHLEDGAHVALDLGVCATAEKCVAGS